jgi:hypothetical protein
MTDFSSRSEEIALNPIQPISDDFSTDGYLNEYARVDHQHPLSESLRAAIFAGTTYVQKAGDTMTGPLQFTNAGTPAGGFFFNVGASAGFVIGAGHAVYGGIYATMYRMGKGAAGQYTFLTNATGDTYFNAETNMYVRINNADRITLAAAITVAVSTTFNSTCAVSGSNVFYFSTYGGGWNMTDTTWIRSYNSKNVYCDATIGCNLLSVNLGGAVTSGYALDCGGVAYFRNWVRSDNYFWCYRGDSVVWNTANYQAYSNANYVAISWYQAAGGAAPQIRNHSSEGYRLTAVNSDQSGYSNYKASAFEVASSLDYKKDIRSLSEDFEPRPGLVDWDADLISLVDIMALRPAIFRKRGFPQKVVGSPEKGHKIIEDMDPLWQLEYYRERLGLIAEEVAHVIPSAIQFRWPDAKPDAIDYAQVTVALLDHVQRLTRTVETLQYRIIELEEAA